MPKVLIIEDRRENIVFIANNILKPMGYDVITAMDGQTGLAKALEEKPDLIITDLKLPRMSGLEVLSNLNEQGMNIPTIVMTFHGTEDTAMRALRLGARDYLIKPFTIEEMQEAIDRAVAGSSQRSEDAEVYERLEQELEQTRAALAEREDQLKRLSAASQMAAKVPKLEQELDKMRAALASRQAQFESHPRAGTAAPKIAELEQELAQTRQVLAHRENQLIQAKKYLTNLVKKADPTELNQQIAALKEENARLQDAVAKANKQAGEFQERAAYLEEKMRHQKMQMEKYHHQAARLAEELRNLTQAVRLLSQDLGQQANQLEMVPHAEKSR